MHHKAHDQWNLDTGKPIQSMLRSEQTVSSSEDRFAWHLKQAGHLCRREYDQLDAAQLADELIRYSNEQLFLCRSHCRDVVKVLLLLANASSTDSKARTEWKRDLVFRRVQISQLLRSNPSMKEFLPAILSFAWHVGRMYAAMDLHSGHYLPLDRRYRILKAERLAGNWNSRLPFHCPWRPSEILGYDPSNTGEALTDPRSLPFEEPAAASVA